MLTMLTGEMPGKGFLLDRDEMVIGRRADCDIILADKSVSRLHARIVRRDNSLYLENLENRNETKINGAPLLEPHRLKDGDRIIICKYLIIYNGFDGSLKG